MYFLTIYALLLALSTLGLTLRVRDQLPGLVEWDEYSLSVHGEKIMIFSGEFHPFRLPVPELWLDIFQKLKAAGFSAVSFYVDWALLEGTQGKFRANGVFALDQFFDAATEAGMYLIARPGPYINAEASGGGFPGWLGRTTEKVRTPAYLPYTETYARGISEMIAPAQITNGGPVILLQPENEYTSAAEGVKFPDHKYMAAVEQQFRSNGINVPFISNDQAPAGYFAPGTGLGAVDIYGHDGYPLGGDCSDPSVWGQIPTDWFALHQQQSPSTPYSILEFQAGAPVYWGDSGSFKCSLLANEEYERVFYKNNYGAGVTIYNLYMAYGGTNWGNLGHPGGYTSYDYGAAIAENRTLTREKYHEVKLQANFFKVSPAYLSSAGSSSEAGKYVDTEALSTARVTDNRTSIYAVRHAQYDSAESTQYSLKVTTSRGDMSIPRLGGRLTLNGRDSKMHVVDYDVGGVNMVYSTAEVFTWQKYGNEMILILYGGENETHEAAFDIQGEGTVDNQEGVRISNGTINWDVGARKIVRFPDLTVYLLWRNEVYNYWVLDLPDEKFVRYQHANATSVIARAGYLLRTADIHGDTLRLTGDLNATAPLEIIGSPEVSQIEFNGQKLATETKDGIITATLEYQKPEINIPSLADLPWSYLDSLPEITRGYNDSNWTSASLPSSNNTIRPLTTPTSLYGVDYGYVTSTLIFRGHFTAHGTETSLNLTTQGGLAYAHSAWLDSTYLGSWTGNKTTSTFTASFAISPTAGAHVLTVLVDTTGLEETQAGADGVKTPRGILDYTLEGRDQSAITWKITGNFGGEDYADVLRGPLNEGGTYAERMGLHLPGAPRDGWIERSPLEEGLDAPGVGFFATAFDLEMPRGYDVPLSFVFANVTEEEGVPARFRALFFVNGWQFGKFVNNVGPQTVFPVPVGILDYRGRNEVAVSVWAMEEGGVKLGGLELVVDAVVQSAYGEVGRVEAEGWKRRDAF